MNSFGKKLILTTYGESHGVGIGGVLDGLPAGIRMDLDFIQDEIDKRKAGTRFSTQRKESDTIEIYSGLFDGFTTGMPIGFFIKNSNTKSKDYDNIKELYRPSHADFTYDAKFGIRDYKGGGRSSARESVARVGAGAMAQLLLNEFNIEIQSGLFAVGSKTTAKFDFELAKNSEIFALGSEDEFKKEILGAKNSHDSVGGAVLTIVKNLPKGLGEVLYDKLDARIAAAVVGINGVKAVEIGAGVKLSKERASKANDQMDKNGFLSNNSGGILGGISNGEELVIKSYFKPTPSIFLPLKTVDKDGNEVIMKLKGRHDPCIAVRGSVVVTAMIRLLIADMMLLNLGSKLEHLHKIYSSDKN